MFPSKDGRAPQDPPPTPRAVRDLEAPPVLLMFCCSISRWMHCGDWGTTPPREIPLIMLLRKGFTLAQGVGVEEGIGAGHLRMSRVTLSSRLRDVC